MKTIFFFFFFVFISCTLCAQDWSIAQGNEDIKSDKDVSEKIFVCTNLRCYILFENRLMISKDGCNTWQRSSLDTDYPDYIFNDCIFFDDMKGVVSAGYKNASKSDIIFRTTDAGFSWSIIYTGQRKYDLPLRFSKANNSTAFAWGRELVEVGVGIGVVYRTTNSGITWHEYMTISGLNRIYSYNDSTFFLRFIKFLPPFNTVILSSIVKNKEYNKEGDFTGSYLIVDNNLSWKILDENTLYYLNSTLDIIDSVQFVQELPNNLGYTKLFDEYNGFLVGYFREDKLKSVIYETRDGGISWRLSYEFPATGYNLSEHIFYTRWGAIGRTLDNRFIINADPKYTVSFESSQLSIYPNPATSHISISIPSEELTIYSLLGESLIRTEGIYENVNIENLPTGYYILKAHSVLGSYTKPFIKQ